MANDSVEAPEFQLRSLTPERSLARSPQEQEVVARESEQPCLSAPASGGVFHTMPLSPSKGLPYSVNAMPPQWGLSQGTTTEGHMEYEKI